MENTLNLTNQQKNIWNTEMFYSNTSVNNICGYIYIKEKVDFELLEKTANIFVEHTDSMRFQFEIKDDEAVQHVSTYKKFKTEIIETKNIEETNKLCSRLLKAPFKMINSNLFKFTLFKYPNGTGGIIGVFHHLICDAWSMGLLVSRLMEIYSMLVKSNYAFEDYTKYEQYIIDSQKYMQSTKIKNDRTFWNEVFEKEPVITHIYKDKKASGKDINSCEGSRESFEIDKNLYEKIASFSKENNCSVYTFFMAIYLIYLAKINDTKSAIIGTPVLNRRNFNEKQIIGMFVSNVPFKMDINSNLEFSKFLKQVELNQTAIYRHQKYPYLELLKDIKEKFDMSENLYDFVLSYQNARDNKKTSDIDYESGWVPNSNVANPVEVHFYDMDNTGKVNIFYNYQTSKFTKEDIENLHKRIINMAKSVLKNPAIKNIEVITKEEKSIINKFNATEYKYNKKQTIVEVFEKQVRKNKNKICAKFKDKTLTYGELDEKSNQVANILLSKQIKKDDVVGIMLNRSLDLHIAMWGVLKTGAAYMLIDPNLPEDRVNYMLTNAKCPIVITNLYINYETVDITNLENYSNKQPKVKSSNEDRFCVLYTSGSTGMPKGVELRRLSVINLVNSFKKILHTNICENYLSTSTVSFDMFVVENFLSILSGKTVILADEDEQKIPAFTSKLIVENNIDFIVSTPSKISLLLNENECLRDVKVIQLGGEVFKPSLYKELRKATNAEIHNGYGPSETCACASNKHVIDENDITIGTPYLNVKMYIMNKDENILPIDIPGELVITGDGVGLGYVNKQRFNGVYRTGDIAKLNKNGELVYYGRKDNQIKLHGLRIELDEITEKIIKLEDIKNAITVIKKVNDIDSICAYIETTDSELTEKTLKKALAKELPNYMVPSHIVFMDHLPITANGKVDSKNLPEIIVEDKEFIKSETDTEKKVEKIWKKVLKLNKISTLANFFDLGGDSLCSIMLVSEIYNDLKVKIEVKDIFEYPTIKELSEFIDTKEVTEEKTEKIKKHEKAEYYPVSSAQRRIYYTASMQEESLAYNTPFGILFDKVPDVKKLENAIGTIINRHEAFRTYFELKDTDVVQKVVEKIDFKLKVSNSKNEDFVKPFDLGKAPLMHIELDKFDGKALLQMDMHHIICDGTSIGIFAKELCDLYNEKELKENKIDYIDYAISEKIEEKDKEYWLSTFENGVPLLNMPTEFERASIKSEEGESIFEKLENVDKINEFCKSKGITPYMFLLSSYYILLYKYTMQNEIVVGTPTVGRNNAELSDIVGMFVNTIALKQNIQSSSTAIDFLNQVKNNCMNAFEHQTYPFDELVKNLNIARDNSRNPVFDTMFIYESEGLPKLDLNGLSSTYVIPENKTSKFDISLEITPTQESYNIRLEYCTKLFGKNFMSTFLDCYKNIVNSIIEEPETQISKIKILTEIPKMYPTLEYPKELRIIDLFEKQVLETPDKIALVFGDEKYTYKELETKVNKLANHIINMPAYKNNISKKKYKVIGIMMDRRAELIVSMFAILKAGAGYLPIDPKYPVDRVKYILEDSEVGLVLTEKNYEDRIEVDSLCVDDENSYDEYKPFDTDTKSSDVSYMIYTSGSTGRPKGVILKQSSVVNFIYGMCDRMPLKDKTIVNITTMCFDIFVLESLLPLCTGMKVVLANNEEQNNPILLNELCLKNNVEVIQTTPSKFKLLMSENTAIEYIQKMKIISLAGEPFTLDLFKKIRNITDAQVFNMYGPTETTVGSTLKEITSLNKKITIGTPIANTEIYVLDNDMNQVPQGVIGTLFIGGDGVSIGYINKPELTSERYIEYNNSRIYNSGDLVKVLPNGEIDCLGRNDFQVKIRGLRIELGEIENAICAYKGVSSSVVAVKNVNGRDILCGYFVATGRVSISNLKNRLSMSLPNYMVPSYLVQLEDFKYTPNGKIDRKELPLPIIKEKEIIAPETKLERKLVKIWEEILSLEKISIDDNFFDIGGDSLCALKLQLEIMKIGYNINYGDIFKNNTIRDLAKFLEENKEEALYPQYTEKDFEKINNFIKKNAEENKIRVRPRKIQNVLLVGATGFLGIHVLAELLKIDSIKIYCLIRKDPSTSPENKLRNKFKYYFGSDLSNLLGTRIFVIDGDITYKNYGLSEEQYNQLGENVEQVINCAALVKHYGDYNVFEKINVTGVKNIIEFCEKFNKEFIQTSTVSVSGNTMVGLANSFRPDEVIEYGEDKLFVNQTLENVYVRSKFEAEKLILEELASKRLKGIILRIGNITNRYSDGKFQENSEDNAFLNRLKAFLALGMIPKSIMENYAEFSPVDKIAEAIIVCMEYYNFPISIMHLYNSKHIYIKELYEILKQLKIDIKIVEDDVFKKKLKKWLYDESRTNNVNVLVNDLDKDDNFVYKTNLVISNKNTLNFLKEAGFDWPEIDIEYIRKVLENL